MGGGCRAGIEIWNFATLCGNLVQRNEFGRRAGWLWFDFIAVTLIGVLIQIFYLKFVVSLIWQLWPLALRH